MTSRPDQSELPQTAALGGGHTPEAGTEHPTAGGELAAVAHTRRPPTIEDEFLTVAEVAAILKLNQQTIRNWILHSRLPSVRVGRRVRVLRRDLDQLIADAVSRVDDPAPRAEGDRWDLWQDAERFWGGP
jgi:excisionase family DNA binding protein